MEKETFKRAIFLKLTDAGLSVEEAQDVTLFVYNNLPFDIKIDHPFFDFKKAIQEMAISDRLSMKSACIKVANSPRLLFNRHDIRGIATQPQKRLVNPRRDFASPLTKLLDDYDELVSGKNPSAPAPEHP